MKTIRIIKSIRHLLLLNKLRIIISLAGIATGIAAVIILVSAGEGARVKMLQQVESAGSNLITVDAGKIKTVIGRKREVAKATTLKIKDAEAIAEIGLSAGIVLTAATQEQSLLVKYGNGTINSRIIGTTPEFPAIRNYKIAQGIFFDADDNRSGKRLAVIGDKTRKYLFRDINPIGENIKINNIPFEVAGVLEAKGLSYDGANEDDVILIPLNTSMRRVFNVDYIKNIYVKVNKREMIKTAEDEITNTLRERHRLNIRNKDNDFTIQNIYTALKAEGETNELFTTLITGVAALALLTGGIGILAVMLLSVKERKPEIGLRMAVGAKPGDILFQFLFESVILCTAGGLIGVFSGITGSLLVGVFTTLNTKISLSSLFISVIFSVTIGILFGALPARFAAKINPVTALKD